MNQLDHGQQQDLVASGFHICWLFFKLQARHFLFKRKTLRRNKPTTLNNCRTSCCWLQIHNSPFWRAILIIKKYPVAILKNIFNSNCITNFTTSCSWYYMAAGKIQYAECITKSHDVRGPWCIWWDMAMGLEKHNRRYKSAFRSFLQTYAPVHLISSFQRSKGKENRIDHMAQYTCKPSLDATSFVQHVSYAHLYNPALQEITMSTKSWTAPKIQRIIQGIYDHFEKQVSSTQRMRRQCVLKAQRHRSSLGYAVTPFQVHLELFWSSAVPGLLLERGKQTWLFRNTQVPRHCTKKAVCKPDVQVNKCRHNLLAFVSFYFCWKKCNCDTKQMSHVHIHPPPTSLHILKGQDCPHPLHTVSYSS